MKNLAGSVLFAFLLAACSGQPASLTVAGATYRAPLVDGAPGVAYFSITSAADDRIVGISSPDAQAIEIHASSSEGGISRMEKRDTIELPAGKTVTFGEIQNRKAGPVRDEAKAIETAAGIGIHGLPGAALQTFPAFSCGAFCRCLRTLGLGHPACAGRLSLCPPVLCAQTHRRVRVSQHAQTRDRRWCSCSSHPVCRRCCPPVSCNGRLCRSCGHRIRPRRRCARAVRPSRRASL